MIFRPGKRLAETEGGRKKEARAGQNPGAPAGRRFVDRAEAIR